MFGGGGGGEWASTVCGGGGVQEAQQPRVSSTRSSTRGEVGAERCGGGVPVHCQAMPSATGQSHGVCGNAAGASRRRILRAGAAAAAALRCCALCRRLFNVPTANGAALCRTQLGVTRSSHCALSFQSQRGEATKAKTRPVALDPALQQLHNACPCSIELSPWGVGVPRTHTLHVGLSRSCSPCTAICSPWF